MEYYKNLSLESIHYFCEFDLIWKVEEWRDVPNYFGLYHISDLGRVKSLSKIKLNQGINAFYSKEKILKGAVLKSGYVSVALVFDNNQKTFKIQQLVAMAFLNHIPCGYELVINHKNFIRTDNRKLNLEVITPRENGNKKHIKSSSQYTGVSWVKCRNKWSSKIFINGKNKHLGIFVNEIDAHNAYQEALNNLIIKQ